MSSDRSTPAQKQEELSKSESKNSSAHVPNGSSGARVSASNSDVPRTCNDVTLPPSLHSAPDLGTTDKELSEIILQKKTKDKEGKEFISPDAIDALLTRNVIEHELKGKTRDVALPLVVEYVLNAPAIKVFAILVCCDLVDKMVDVYKSRISDHHLPFEEPDHNQRTTRPESALLANWRYKHQHEFTTNQWMFLAPVFTKDTFFYTLDRRCPLPITSMESGQQGGLTGSVVEVRVHEAHQKVLEKVCSSKRT